MKGVITAAGLGTRSGLDGKMRKEMLPVYDLRENRIVLRPILDVLITGMKNRGVTEIAVVLDPEDNWTREYVETEFPQVTIIYQNERLGYGHAVLMAKDFVGKSDFILNAGDGMVLEGGVLEELVNPGSSCVFLTLMTVPNPEKYGTADVQVEGKDIKVKAVVEKSPKPPSNYALCALYRLPPEVFKHLESQKDENVELTPAIDALIKSGADVKARIIEKGEWVSVGRAEGYIDVLRSTLDKCKK